MKPAIPSKKVAATSPGRTWLKIAFVLVIGIILVKALSWLARSDTPPPAQPSAPSVAVDDSGAVGPGKPSDSAAGTPAPTHADPAVASAPMNDPEIMHADACTSFGAQLRLPPDTRVLAVATTGGRKTGFRIDSGEEAKQVDVPVNSPDHPTVMMVSGRGPTIWNFGLTAGTRVLAVLASGQGRQAIASLDPDTPTLASTDSLQCGYFLMERADMQEVNPIALHVFQRPADRVLLGSGDSVGDRIPDGAALYRSPFTAPETFREQTPPPASAASSEN